MKTENQEINPQKALWFSLSLVIVAIISWLQVIHPLLSPLKKSLSMNTCLMAGLFGMLSFTLSMFLNKGLLKKPHHYRIACLSSTVFGLLLFLALSISHLNKPDPLFLLMLPACSLLGGFFASMINKGFFENNAPPTRCIENEVLAQHTGHMGNLPSPLILKRLFDILFSLTALLISMPIWIIITLLIWWEDPGPVIFIKNSVGRGGKNFKQFKFRSMITNAEETTGPISGYENDERVLFFGKFLRKTALDELPQLINILMGDMSAVGPRPQRTVLVHEYLQEIPEYAARHRVRPGLAGLAQVADSYSISPEVKLAWDLVYIERTSLWFDFKLALAAFILVFILRWRSKKDPEKTIRNLLNISKPGL